MAYADEPTLQVPNTQTDTQTTEHLDSQLSEQALETAPTKSIHITTYTNTKTTIYNGPSSSLNEKHYY